MQKHHYLQACHPHVLCVLARESERARGRERERGRDRRRELHRCHAIFTQFMSCLAGYLCSLTHAMLQDSCRAFSCPPLCRSSPMSRCLYSCHVTFGQVISRHGLLPLLMSCQLQSCHSLQPPSLVVRRNYFPVCSIDSQEARKEI